MPGAPTDHDLLPTVLRLADSIAARIGETAPWGCWFWAGALTRSGYGTYSIGPEAGGRHRSLRAHRAVFMLHHERPIGEGLTLHHLCHVRSCVNPAHLVELTHAENVAADATGGASIRLRPTRRGDLRYAVLFREGGRQRSRTFASPEAAQAYCAQRKAS